MGMNWRAHVGTRLSKFGMRPMLFNLIIFSHCARHFVPYLSINANAHESDTSQSPMGDVLSIHELKIKFFRLVVSKAVDPISFCGLCPLSRSNFKRSNLLTSREPIPGSTLANYM